MTNIDYSKIAKLICEEYKYKYIRFVGSGTYKETFLIEKGNDKFAIKIYKVEKANIRSKREIDEINKLDNTNIAKIVYSNTYVVSGNKFLFSIEKYFESGTLLDIMKKGKKFNKEDIKKISLDIINALNDLYKNNIVHRDIKPENIMFDSSNNNYVLIDFGILRKLDEESLTKTMYSMGPCTPLYASPEQLNNDKNLIDWRSDQFSLAITIVKCLWNIHPFSDINNSDPIINMMERKRITETARKLIIDNKLLPLLKMLEPYPVNRYRIPNILEEEWKNI